MQLQRKVLTPHLKQIFSHRLIDLCRRPLHRLRPLRRPPRPARHPRSRRGRRESGRRRTVWKKVVNSKEREFFAKVVSPCVWQKR